MPRYILFIIFCLYSFSLGAQNKPVNNPQVPAPVRVPKVVPGAYQNVKLNYLRVWEPNIPLGGTDIPSIPTRPNPEVQQETSYFDRMGRVVQLVKRGLTPQGKDVIIPKEYATNGKEEQQYLPYPTTTYNGDLRNNPFEEQAVYYTGLSATGQRFAGERFYYAEEEFENSPLDRKTKEMQVGNSWVGSSRGMSTAHLLNTADELIVKWNIANTAGSIPQANGYYGAGLLTKTQTTDPVGKRSIVYKDFDGNVILQKEEVGTGGVTYDGWLSTYFVYDEAGLQRFIIPPLAVEKIKSTWDFTAYPGVIENLCFYNEYDDRGRLIKEKVPDRGFSENVYDNRNRLVFKQDARQRLQGIWEIVLYDQLNRPTVTGLYRSSKTRLQLQTEMDNAPASGTISTTYTIATYADLVVTTRLSHIREYIASSSITFDPGFESGNDEFEATIDPNLQIVNTSITVVANNPLPSLNQADLIPLVYSYYDNYSWNEAQAFETSFVNKPEKGDNIHKEDIVKADFVPGAATGSRVRILGTDKWLTSTKYYDPKGRTIQTISDNIRGGKDVATLLYDFKDRNISTYEHHTYPGSAVPVISMLTVNNLDHAGRTQNTVVRLNDDPALERVISTNSYFESGELSGKDLGGLRSVAFDYYLNSQLKSINKDYITDGSTGSFGEELYYDYGFTEPLMTGEISGIKWRGDGPARAYGYNYDGASRLLKADFTQYGSGAWTQNDVNFSVSGPSANSNQIKYDANGNIEAMHQKGMKGVAPADIDLLEYVYYDNSNQLKRITDGVNDAASLLGDFKEKTSGQLTDYTFDANGNLVQDANKDISGITYNEIDLPEQVVIPGKGNIQFKYSADGSKHQKIINDQSGTTPKQLKYDYINSMLYENGVLKYIGHDEGRIRVIQKPGQPVAYWFDYFIKDHLGDVRVVYTEQSDVNSYMAGMEPAAAARENSLFSNVDNTRQQKPAGYPGADSTNKFAAKLNAKFPDKRIGPSIVLKVMAGDTVQVKVNAFHKTQAAEKKNPGPAVDMLTPLLQAFGGSRITEGAKRTAVGAARPFSSDFVNNQYQQLKQKETKTPENPLRPKAYLNYVLFDEQFNMVEDNSGVKQVESTPDVVQTLYKEKAAVSRNGYLYVYTSNESSQDVYFDDLMVIMSTGMLLEETHYYPFGLTMEGISSKAVTPATYPENKYRFTGKELQSDEFGNGTGLEWYDFGARMYEPQIGKWFAIDGASKSYSSLSPYHFANNNPVKNKEIDGNRYFPLEWPKPSFNPERAARAYDAKYMQNLKMSTPEGRAEAAYYAQKSQEHAKQVSKYGSNVSRPEIVLQADTPLEAALLMTGTIVIHATPVLGSTVRALQAHHVGDKKGAFFHSTFAFVEGLSMLGGLRSITRAPKFKFDFSPRIPTKPSIYIPRTPLPSHNVAGVDIPLPDPAAGFYPHTTLGGRIGGLDRVPPVPYGPYRQSATFTGGSWPTANEKAVPWSRVDWSDHMRPQDHLPVHQHIFYYDGTNKYWKFTDLGHPFP